MTEKTARKLAMDIVCYWAHEENDESLADMIERAILEVYEQGYVAGRNQVLEGQGDE